MLEHLRGLRTGWKDEIPGKVIHSDAADNRYKVRRNWFTGVVADVENLLTDGEITTDEGRAAAGQLLDTFTSEEFTRRELTSAQDIQTANSLIDVILGKR